MRSVGGDEGEVDGGLRRRSSTVDDKGSSFRGSSRSQRCLGSRTEGTVDCRTRWDWKVGTEGVKGTPPETKVAQQSEGEGRVRSSEVST